MECEAKSYIKKEKKEVSLKGRFRNLAAAFLMVLSTIAPMGGVLTRSVYAADNDPVGSDAPANTKQIIDNGDGTYTIALSVTGKTQSSSTTEVSKANVILVLDTSSSMNTEVAGDTYYEVVGTPTNPANDGWTQPRYYQNNNGSYERVYYRDGNWCTNSNGRCNSFSGPFYAKNRVWAEKDALTKTGGIIDNLLAQNVAGDPIRSDIIEVAVINFDDDAQNTQSFTTSSTSLKNSINGLQTHTGTNWDDALQHAKTLADDKHAAQPNEDTYVIFMTDGDPSEHTSSCSSSDWQCAANSAYNLMNGNDYKFYALFTWGNNTTQLSNLVQYAYTGHTNANNSLDNDLKQYFTDASDTQTMIDALTQIVHNITTGVGYTNIEMTDGVTTMTASNLKAVAGGEISGVKYYRSGGPYSTTANNGLGEEWTDAPHAKYNDKGEIDWELKNGDEAIVLENGVTYTIAFVVWPDQASLDLVAKLNNKEIDYNNDLTPDQRAQISVSGGQYSLKTNTDYPTLTYSTVTTTTVDGETTENVSEPVTVPITNPDPVGLEDEKVVISKQWDSSLDQSQVAKIGSIDFRLYCETMTNEGWKACNSDKPYREYTLTKDSNWVGEELAIAPGVMIHKDSETAQRINADHSYDSQIVGDYIILEPGHKYHFEEVGSDAYAEYLEHFDLTKYVYHPMIVKTDDSDHAVMMNVIFSEDGTDILDIEPFDENKGLYAENTLKGGINIEKKLNGADVGQEFEMTVYLVDAEGKALPEHEANAESESAYSYDYKVYYNNKKSIEENCSDTNPCDTGHKFGTGTSFTESIRPGDVIRVVNVMSGAYFRVVENEDLPIGYRNVGTEYSIGTKENPSDAEPTYSAYGDADTAMIGGEKYYVVKGNYASRAIVENEYASTDLSIKKIINLVHGDQGIKNKKFNFEVTLKDGDEAFEGDFPYTIIDAKGETVSTGTISADNNVIELGDGETATIADLPVGASYEVKEVEANKNGFTTSVNGIQKGELDEDGESLVYTNSYSASPVSTEVTVKKDFNDWNGDKFYFTLYGQDGRAIGNPVEVSEQTNKEVTFNFNYTEPGEYTYTIKETTEDGTIVEDGTFGDRGIVGDPNEVTVTVKVADGGLTDDEDMQGKLYIVDGYPIVSSNATITNTYESVGSLQLYASKLLDGRAWQNGDSFTFTLYQIKDGVETAVEGVNPITINQTNYQSNVAFSTINYETFEGDSTEITYVIREDTSNLPEGVEATTGSVTINVTLTNDHHGHIITNFDNNEYVAAFTNTYTTKPTTAPLQVVKTIEDKTGSKKDGSFTFELQKKNEEGEGYSVVEDIDLTTSNLSGSKSFTDLTFNKAGTYEYKVVELEGNTNGFTYDSAVYDVTIVVKDNTDDAQLYIESTTITKDGNPVNAIEFKNTYEADASDAKVKFDIEKTLTGFAGETPATFTFNMTGDATDTQTIQGSGSASFKELKYTEVGEHTYTISEQKDDAAGYSYDQSVYTVTVNVVDEDAKLVPKVEIKKNGVKVDGIKFENTYSASGKANLEITKAFAGDERDWDNETFEFELTGDGISEAITAEAKKSSDWIAKFRAIDYEAVGEYKYTIAEKDSGLANVKASDPIEVTVNVIDNGDGTLTATPTYSNNATITNTYTTTGTTAKLHVDKKIDDQSLSGVDGDFDFTLSGDDYSSTVTVTTNNGEGGADFDEIEFTAAGTYNFTLKEVAGNEAGYTYDEKEYPVVIVVEDNYETAQLEVKSIKIDDKDATSITITNVYKATAATYEIVVKKTLNGLADGLEPAVFTFELAGDATGTQTISGAGETTFGPFIYDTTGTYNYTITETKGSAGGYSYDGASYTIEVKVEDEGGRLAATPTIKKDGESATSVEFVNIYEATGSAELSVTKDLQGREWLDSDKFEFTLYGPDGNAIGEPVTVNKNDKVAEFTIPYTEADHGQTYEYKISETGTLPAGFKKPEDITATVKVTDNGDGTLKTEVTDGGKFTMVNTYKTSATDTTIHVNKKIDDQSNSHMHNNQINGTFYFTLSGEGYSDRISVTTKDLVGGKDFKPIEFTKAGTYVYTLKEVEGILAGFTYDTAEYQVVVVVEDNYETAQLEVKSVTVQGEKTDDWTITNTYKAKPVDVQFTVDKVLNGMNEGVEPATFTFELTGDIDGDGVEDTQTVNINGTGSASFDTITFEKAGTYTFEVAEMNDGLGGYIYDIAKFIIEVTVTDEGGKLVADVQIKKDGQSANEITFENSYKAEPVVDYTIGVVKELEGRELKEGEFSFTLYDADGNEVETVLNAANGIVTFSGLTFDKPGEYVFTVKENIDESKGDIEYDTNEYTITIVVKDDGEGALYVESDDSAEVVFSNKWNEPGHGEDLPPSPNTEDDIANSIALFSMSIIGLIGAIIFGKRKATEEE